MHEYDTICDNERYEWRKHTLKKYDAGTYTMWDSLKTAAGCDSVYRMDLVVNPTYYYKETHKMCESESYTWQQHQCGHKADTLLSNLNYGTYIIYDSLVSVNGCDSVYRLTLEVQRTYAKDESRTICDNELPYTWTTFDKDGEHTYTFSHDAGTIYPKELVQTGYLHTTAGCDSIVTLHLHVNPNYLFTTDTLIGNNETILWRGKTFNGALLGDRTDPYIFDDSIAGGTQEYGCDSIYRLRLSVAPSYTIADTAQICTDGSYHWYHAPQIDTILYGIQVRPEGLYRETYEFRDTLKTIFGCDSVFSLLLEVDSTYLQAAETTLVHICDNETYLFHQDQNPDVIYNAHGEWKTSDYKIHSYELSGTDTTLSGCDSAVLHIVYVHPSYEYTESDSVCQTLPYTWAGHEGHSVWDAAIQQYVPANAISTHRQGGTIYQFIDSLQTTTCNDCLNHAGCDSIWTLYLRIDSVYFDSISAHTSHTMSDEESYKWEHTVYVGSKVNQDTLSALWFEPEKGEGVTCPIVRVPSESIVNLYYVNYQTIHECDSTLRLRLVVGPTYRDTIVRYTCENEPYHWYHEWDNHEVKPEIEKLEAKFYYDSLKTVAYGFDSIYVLDLRNNPVYSFEMEDTICQGEAYEWEGHTMSSRFYLAEAHRWVDRTAISTSKAGLYTYIDSLKTLSYQLGEGQAYHEGCDSVWVLKLLVPPSYYHYDTARVLCDNDTTSWQRRLYVGNKYSAFLKTYDSLLYDTVIVMDIRDGIFRDTVSYMTDVFGCDSVYYLQIAWHPTKYSEQERDVCQNEIVEYEAMHNGLGGIVPTADTATLVYLDTIPGEYTCDSVIHITYHVHPVYRFTQDTTVCQDRTIKDWQWTDAEGNPRKTDKPISIAEPGWFFYGDTLSTQVYGCDSLYGIRVHVTPTYYFHDTVTICQNDTMHWQDSVIAGDLYEGLDALPRRSTLGAGVYHYSINYGTHDYGCDSVYNLVLHILPARIYVPEADTTIVHICDNETYHFKGGHFDSIANMHNEWVSGDHQSHRYILTGTDTTGLECDSAVAHIVWVHPTYSFIQDTVVCQDTVNPNWIWTVGTLLRLWAYSNMAICGKNADILYIGTIFAAHYHNAELPVKVKKNTEENLKEIDCHENKCNFYYYYPT